MTLDVLTMAARAGCTPRLAIMVAAEWSPPAASAVLADVDRRCRLGASLVDALDHAGRAAPSLRPMTDTLAVAERSGAPIADLVSRLADEARTLLRRRAEAHARRVPVRLLFPLVFLVLPAFGLLTVVPALINGLRHT
jgi:Flp pilus assembly protein TadB